MANPSDAAIQAGMKVNYSVGFDYRWVNIFLYPNPIISYTVIEKKSEILF
jgi:hypothetical protein